MSEQEAAKRYRELMAAAALRGQGTSVAANPLNSGGDQWAVRSRNRAAIRNRNNLPWQIRNEPVGISDEPNNDLRSIRNRSRTLERDNGVAQAMLRAIRDYTVMSNGFTVQAGTDDDDWNSRAHDLWETHTQTADVQGREWVDWCSEVINAEARDGDICVIKLGDGRVQAVEGHRLRTPHDGGSVEGITAAGEKLSVDPSAEGMRIRDGVEMDAAGRPVRFWFSEFDTDSPGKPIWYDAADVLFLARGRPFSGTRGYSIFSHNAGDVDVLDGVIEATGIKERLAACIALALNLNDPSAQVGSQPYGLTDPSGQRHRVFELAPGAILNLTKDEKAELLKPIESAESLTQFVLIMCRVIGAPVGLPMELILLDMSQNSFAGVRATLLASHVTFRRMRRQFVYRLLRPLYIDRVNAWVRAGILEDRPDKFHHSWSAELFPYIDPESDIKAEILERDGGYATHEEQLARRGKRFVDWVGKAGKEAAAKRKENLPIVHSVATADFDSKAAPSGGGKGKEPIEELADAVNEKA